MLLNSITERKFIPGTQSIKIENVNKDHHLHKTEALIMSKTNIFKIGKGMRTKGKTECRRLIGSITEKQAIQSNIKE